MFTRDTEAAEKDLIISISSLSLTGAQGLLQGLKTDKLQKRGKGFKDSRVQGFFAHFVRRSPASGFPVTRSQGVKGSRIQGVKGEA